MALSLRVYMVMARPASVGQTFRDGKMRSTEGSPWAEKCKFCSRPNGSPNTMDVADAAAATAATTATIGTAATATTAVQLQQSTRKQQQHHCLHYQQEQQLQQQFIRQV
jgi:ribosome-binding protein aMBF1 (putative translation factor)